MAKIFITGAADGLGQLAAKKLVALGHTVVLHARNEERGRDALAKVSGAQTVLTANLASISETIALSEKVNTMGPFDAVIHNAGLYNAPAVEMFHVNTLAPYILTCLIAKPERLIYLSSDMHQGGRPKLDSFTSGPEQISYSDTKLHVLMLCKVLARQWKDVFANAVNPGWVPTKMGGAGAPDDLQKGYETQVWLAVSEDEQAKVSGRYFHHQKEVRYNAAADDIHAQERFMELCGELTGVWLP